jgi:hypothetical protein
MPGTINKELWREILGDELYTLCTDLPKLESDDIDEIGSYISYRSYGFARCEQCWYTFNDQRICVVLENTNKQGWETRYFEVNGKRCWGQEYKTQPWYRVWTLIERRVLDLLRYHKDEDRLFFYDDCELAEASKQPDEEEAAEAQLQEAKRQLAEAEEVIRHAENVKRQKVNSELVTKLYHELGNFPNIVGDKPYAVKCPDGDRPSREYMEAVQSVVLHVNRTIKSIYQFYVVFTERGRCNSPGPGCYQGCDHGTPAQMIFYRFIPGKVTLPGM